MSINSSSSDVKYLQVTATVLEDSGSLSKACDTDLWYDYNILQRSKHGGYCFSYASWFKNSWLQDRTVPLQMHAQEWSMKIGHRCIAKTGFVYTFEKSCDKILVAPCCLFTTKICIKGGTDSW